MANPKTFKVGNKFLYTDKNERVHQCTITQIGEWIKEEGEEECKDVTYEEYTIAGKEEHQTVIYKDTGRRYGDEYIYLGCWGGFERVKYAG